MTCFAVAPRFVIAERTLQEVMVAGHYVPPIDMRQPAFDFLSMVREALPEQCISNSPPIPDQMVCPVEETERPKTAYSPLMMMLVTLQLERSKSRLPSVQVRARLEPFEFASSTVDFATPLGSVVVEPERFQQGIVNFLR
jgi:hypothetical protein